jgi:hypothetical protein
MVELIFNINLGDDMKTEIFLSAIRNRNNLRFLYDLKETVIEPYYVSRERTGKKVIYGRLSSTNEIKRFAYNKITNIRVMKNLRFSPVIPIIPLAS